MAGQGFNFHVPHRSLPEQNHPRFDIQLDYGPPDGGVAPPVSQLSAAREQERTSVAEGGEEASDDTEADFDLTPPSSQDTMFSFSQDSYDSGDAGPADTHLTDSSTAPAPTQPAQAFRPITRTRTIRKEDTLMAIDAPSVADEVEMRMLPIFQSMCGKMCSDICNRQAQSAAEIHGAITQAYLQIQREVLALKQEVNNLRIQVAEQRRTGY